MGTRSRLVVAFVLLLAPGVAGATCPEKVHASRLELLLDDAEAAWSRLDTDTFGKVADQLAAEIPCLAEPPDRAFAARYHRLQGLRAFAARDSVRARSAFAASRRLEPAALLPSTFAPAGHPIQDTFVALPTEAVTTRPVPPPTDGNVYFDAAKTRERPANVPTLFQWRDASGAVRATAYVWPTEPLPAYPSKRPGVSPRPVLLGAAGATGVLALGLTATTVLASDAYWDPATPRERLDGLRGLVNGAGGAAIGLGVATGGLAVASFVVPLGG